MVIYLMIAVILLLFMKNDNKYVVLGIFFLLFLVSAFRGVTVGTDTQNYYDLYSGNATSTRLEPGFALFFLGCKAIGVPFRVILIIFSVMMFSMLYIFTKKTKYQPMMVLLFFFLLGYCFSFYNVVRQMLAAGILMFAYENRRREGNILFFCLFIFLAMMLHKSAILGAVIFFLDKIKIRGPYIMFLLPLTFIFPFVIPTNEIMDYMTSHISFLSHYDVYSGSADKQMFSVNRLAMNVFFMYLASRYDKSGDIYWNASILGLIILNMFPFSGIITRSAIYFQIAQIVFLTNFYQSSKEVDRILVMAYSLVIFLFTMINNIGGIVPYSFGGF